MLTIESLQTMRDKLDVYDVDQHGWEQETNGFIPNILSTISYLDDTTWFKDLTVKNVISEEVAPDMLQFALRLSRWADFAVSGLVPRGTETDAYIDRFAGNYPKTVTNRKDIIAINGARALLSTELIDDTQRQAVNKETTSVIKKRIVSKHAGRLLVFAAQFQADHEDANLVDLFDSRLAMQREINGIINPELLIGAEFISKTDFRRNWMHGFSNSWSSVVKVAETELNFPLQKVTLDGEVRLVGDVETALIWLEERNRQKVGRQILVNIVSGREV